MEQFTQLEEITPRLQALAVDYGLALLGALLVLVVGFWVAGAIARFVERAATRSDVDPTLAKFLRTLSRAILLTLVILSALSMLGINTTSFIAVVGAAGLAIGLALQDSLQHFASGVMIIFFRPFSAGDFVEVAGVTGKVEEVHLFSSRLVTPDNKLIIVPNAEITGGNIINYTAKDTRRVDLTVGIGYGDDIGQAKRVLEELARGHELTLEDPAPVVAVGELGDSSVNLLVRPWVKTEDYWTVYWDLTEQIKLRFDNEGIELPFPQRDLHLVGGPGTPTALTGDEGSA